MTDVLEPCAVPAKVAAAANEDENEEQQNGEESSRLFNVITDAFFDTIASILSIRSIRSCSSIRWARSSFSRRVLEEVYSELLRRMFLRSQRHSPPTRLLFDTVSWSLVQLTPNYVAVGLLLRKKAGGTDIRRTEQ